MAILDNHLVRIAARLLWDGASDVINSFHVVCTDNNNQTTEDLIIDLTEAIEDLYDLLDALMPNNATFVDMNVSNYSAGEVYGSSDWPTLTAGGAAQDAISPALGVFSYTPTNIPNVQGRKWWGPFTENVMGDGAWAVGVTGIVETVMALLTSSLASGIGAVWTPTIAHLKEVVDGVLVDADPPEFRTYGSAVTTANPGVLTRRRPGSGS